MISLESEDGTQWRWCRAVSRGDRVWLSWRRQRRRTPDPVTRLTHQLLSPEASHHVTSEILSLRHELNGQAWVRSLKWRPKSHFPKNYQQPRTTQGWTNFWHVFPKCLSNFGSEKVSWKFFLSWNTLQSHLTRRWVWVFWTTLVSQTQKNCPINSCL